MSIWICCWKLVSGYVCTYMDMLDFYVLDMLDLMKYVVGHAVGYVGYVCMYICV